MQRSFFVILVIAVWLNWWWGIGRNEGCYGSSLWIGIRT